MINSYCQRLFFQILSIHRVSTALLVSLISLAAAPAMAQVPSNVYRPPTDNFNQGGQRILPAQPGRRINQNVQQWQTFPAAPQYQSAPVTQGYYYPPQGQTPIYRQPIREIPGQIIAQPGQILPQPGQAVPQQSQVVPAQNASENVELKRSLVKARDLIQKYQLKLEDASRSNKELQSEITTLRESGDMSKSDTSSQELIAAKAAAAEAQGQMSGLNEKLQTALRNLETSSGDLDRQKQIGAQLQTQIVELQNVAKMSAGSDEQLTKLTNDVQQFRSQNDELNGKVTTLQNALREKQDELSEKDAQLRQKETQIASMGSNDDSQLADVRELLEESETTNKDLSARLKMAQAEAAEMSAPQADPALNQLQADNQELGQKNQQLGQKNQQLLQLNQQLGQQKQQLESQNGQLNGMLENLQSKNMQLDETVTRLSNMPAPQESMGFAAAAPAVTPSPDLTGLQNQLSSLTRRNGQLERQLKLSKSKYASLNDENAQLMKAADSESPIEVAATPLVGSSVVPEMVSVAVATPELGLSSVSAGWPVKYWIFGMLGVGLAVGLGVAWYESVVDPKTLRRSTNSA